MKLLKFFFLAFGVLTLALAACSKQENDQGNITIQVFQHEGSLWTEFQLEDAFSQQQIGTTPKNAIVPIVFDRDGRLCNADEVNDMIANDISYSEYYTSLIAFQNITKQPTATAEYAMPLDGRWYYDPYQIMYETREERERNIQKRDEELLTLKDQDDPQGGVSSRSVPAWAQKGNIVYGRWSGWYSFSNYVGHTGGIIKEALVSGSNGTIMANTKTDEASQGSGVFTRYMTNQVENTHWNHSSCYLRAALWPSNVTSAQRTLVASYQNSQIGEPYSIATSKSNSSSWYCSKLQWKAYKVQTDIDIDKNGGTIVYPDDIYTNSNLVGMSF